MTENNPPNQISLPEHIYKMYSLFEKTSDPNHIDNPFRDYKSIDDIKIKIARNISNLNYYTIDIPFSDQLNPKFIIQYIKNIDYRNYFSSDSISFKLLKQISETHWKEEESYSGHKTVFDVLIFNFQILFYNSKNNLNTNTSEAKYYNSYKILKKNNGYVLRFEIVLNNMDMDQDIDINIYLNMLLNILKAVYNRFKLNFDIVINKIERPRSLSDNTLKSLPSILNESERSLNRPKSADLFNKNIDDKSEKGTQTDFDNHNKSDGNKK